MPRASRLRRAGSSLFSPAAGASLALFAATAALWLRTEVAPAFDFFVVQTADTSYGLGTEPGFLIGFLQRQGPGYRDGDAADVQLVGAGFRYLRISSAGMRRWNLVLPFWLLACILLGLPSYWLAGRLKDRRRRRAGLCPVCSYDLRATPDRCPECGTAVAR